eukprot:3615776-Pleurochrysis_carterae.AAC.1
MAQLGRREYPATPEQGKKRLRTATTTPSRPAFKHRLRLPGPELADIAAAAICRRLCYRLSLRQNRPHRHRRRPNGMPQPPSPVPLYLQ